MKKVICLVTLLVILSGCTGSDEYIKYTIQGAGDGWSVNNIQFEMHDNGDVTFNGGELIIESQYEMVELDIFQVIDDRIVTIENASFSLVEGVVITRGFSDYTVYVEDIDLDERVIANISLSRLSESEYDEVFGLLVSELEY